MLAPGVFMIEPSLENPQEWYGRQFGATAPWEYDGALEFYRSGSICLSVKGGCTVFEDLSETVFYGWPVERWLKLAGAGRLLYGFYSEDACEAEFVHIQDGRCIREYREYGGETEADEGDEPAFADWTDVAGYIDENLL